MSIRPIAAAAMIIAAAPAAAVGLAPLAKEGATPGPAKAFYLTVINPYDTPRAFRAYADHGATDITIYPAALTIKAGGQRRIVVVVSKLAAGESREVRICAELAKQEGMIHARVCSKLSATRLAPRAR